MADAKTRKARDAYRLEMSARVGSDYEEICRACGAEAAVKGMDLADKFIAELDKLYEENSLEVAVAAGMHICRTLRFAEEASGIGARAVAQ